MKKEDKSSRHERDLTDREAEEAMERGVLEAKSDAGWQWADTVADGELGLTELKRLADRVGWFYTAEQKLKEVCDALGLDAADEAVSIDEQAFAIECRAHEPAKRAPNEDVMQPVERWFTELQLKLVEERSCLDDVLAICGC